MNPVEECRKINPKTVEEFEKILNEMLETFCKKQLDYGPQNITLGGNLEKDDEKNFALVGLWMRMNDKMQRIKNMVLSKKNAQNEPLTDSWLDLSMYAIICRIVDKKIWGK